MTIFLLVLIAATLLCGAAAVRTGALKLLTAVLVIATMLVAAFVIAAWLGPIVGPRIADAAAVALVFIALAGLALWADLDRRARRRALDRQIASDEAAHRELLATIEREERDRARAHAAQ